MPSVIFSDSDVHEIEKWADEVEKLEREQAQRKREEAAAHPGHTKLG